MALQKSFENSSGNIGDYWRVDQIGMSRQDMKLEVRMNLYRSKVDRNSGKRRMDEQKVLVLEIPPAGTTLSQMIAGIYTQAKITPTNDQASTDIPFFDGAVDI